MFRAIPLSLVATALLALTLTAAADPPEDADARLSKALSVQTAMVRARSFLTDHKSQKAVEILEDQLPKVNGNPEYLALLRDAYRTYVKDLLGAGQLDQAKRYLDRLCILDPSAANDSALRPHAETPPRKFEPALALPNKVAGQFPNFKMPTLPNLFGKKEESKKPPLIVRGQSEDAILEDPFDRKNQRESAPSSIKGASARELLARGAEEFKLKRYPEARVSFEQAYQADGACLDACREQWAYCIIACANDAMKQPGAKFADLKQQVESAIGMAPAKFMATGQELLQELERRGKTARTGPQIAISAVSVRHLGASADGWFVTETAHFRIFHRQDNQLAEEVARVAEHTRQTMYRKWFGHDDVEWQPIDLTSSAGCELILHANAAGYTQMTGVPSNSPGHSKIESDRATGRVISRRMDMRLDLHGMTETVLPHETTHVVLAGMFGAAKVPRWADEGIAVLSEPEAKIAQHRSNLSKGLQSGRLFGLKELMELDDYPHPSRIQAFYAQSVVLVEFLANQRGPKVFGDFVKDGLRSGYEQALQRHYNMTFADLDQAWHKHLRSNLQSVASQR